MRRFRTGAKLMLASAVAIVAAGLAAQGADAATVSGYAQSVRWSGWIVQQRGLHFNRVSASWRVPSANCSPNGLTNSVAWVGLGGSNENRLEQIGSETDCAPSGDKSPGVPYALLWWEVLPAPEQYPTQDELKIGDRVTASVTIARGLVTVEMIDRTAHWTFVRHARPKPHELTTSSADWIVEDPEICPGSKIVLSCPEKPYAHFKRVTFTGAHAGTTSGLSGTISDRAWTALKYGLVTDSGKLLSWPSPLNATGSGFSVSRTNRPAPAEPPPPA